MTTEKQRGKIKAMVFDLFGTLIDSPNHLNPYQSLFEKLELGEAEFVAFRRIVMTENLETLDEVANRFRPGIAIDLTDCQMELEQKSSGTFCYPETMRVLAELRNRRIAIGLISNLASTSQIPFFNLGLARYFDQVIFSFEVGLVKPQPEIYQLMINRLGIEPNRIMMTGDKFSKDVEAPIAAGMQAVLLDRSGQVTGSLQTLEEIFQYLPCS